MWHNNDLFWVLRIFVTWKKIDIYCVEIGDEIVSWWSLNTSRIKLKIKF